MPIYRGENLMNYILQIRSLAAVSDKSALDEMLGKTAMHVRPTNFPTRLHALSNIFGRSLPPVHELFQFNTNMGIFRLTVPPQDFAQIHSHAISEPNYDMPGLTGMRGRVHVPDNVMRQSVSEAFCPACLVEDQRPGAVGRAYLRCHWQFAEIAVCSTHQISLVTGCFFCRNTMQYRKKIRRFGEQCICGKLSARRVDESDSKLMESELRIAAAFDAFRGLVDDEKVGFRNVQHVLRRRATELGLLTTRVRLHDFDQLAREVHHPSVYTHYKTLWNRNGALTQLLRESQPLRNPMNNAFLVSLMYESPTQFASDVKGSRGKKDSHLSSDVSPVVREVRPRSREKVERAKHELLAFTEQNPGASRTQIRKANRQRWYLLNTHARPFLQQHLPAKKGLQPGECVRREPRIAKETRLKRDSRVSNCIRQRRAEYDREPPRFRITAGRLLAGIRGAGAVYRKDAQMFLSKVALGECTEKPEAYARRIKKATIPSATRSQNRSRA
ncbi:TniQ family protein [Paraburkholderia sp. EG287A]|uniref:TniQ family protein n=1 Tax=Paraburkholderia sp. EG287A TaxID=3237012 RepID=UPI0034D33633